MKIYQPVKSCIDNCEITTKNRATRSFLLSTILAMFLGILIPGFTFAQLTGIKTIGVDYPSFNAAVADLNLQGVGAGGVTLNIPAGYTESAPAGGFVVTATGTLANPIIIQKSGAGADPIFTAYTGGTATAASLTAMDGILRFIGSDWVTIDGISLQDNVANSGTAMMEYGMAFYKANTSNGCNNNTIRNCFITLNRNNISSSGSTSNVNEAAQGSCGILFANATFNVPSTPLIISSTNGTNSNNKIYSNTIQNCNTGIHMKGYNDVIAPFAFYDQSNDIGGNSPSTGNTITGFGTPIANPNTILAAGVVVGNNNAVNISNNTLTATGGTSAHLADCRGIWNASSNAALATYNNNTVSVRQGTYNGFSSNSTAIENAAGSSIVASIINMTNNTITNCVMDSGINIGNNNPMIGLRVSGTPSTVNITGNLIYGNTMYNAGTYTAILYAGTNLSANVNITSNQIYNILKTQGNQASGGGNNLIGIQSSAGQLNISSNQIHDFSITNLGVLPASTMSCQINAISLTSPSTVINSVISNNSIYNLSMSGASTSSTAMTMRGIFFGSNTGTNALNLTISGNTISNFTASNSFATAGGTLLGIEVSSGVTINAFNNKISDLSGTGSAMLVFGMNILSGNNVNLYNNYVGNLFVPQALGAEQIIGINDLSSTSTGGQNRNIYNNTVYLSGTSSAATFGSSAFKSAFTPNLSLRNNIFINNTTPQGTGFAVAHRRSGTSIVNYLSSSNNNIFYAGVPSATHLIYYDGTNSDQTLAAFKTRVAGRENGSATENVAFLSLVGANSNFLHVNSAIATAAESGGTNIATFTSDFDGDVRAGNLGYGGSGSSYDIGADEFGGIVADLAPPVVNAGSILASCNTGDRIISGVIITDATGVPITGSLVPRIYYKKNVGGTYFSQPGTLNSGTGNNGSWSFTIVAADMGGLTTTDSVGYYFIAQDVVAIPNISSTPSGAVALDVNTVTTPPTAVNYYKLLNTLSGSYNVGVGGTWTTITAAVAAYNNSCLAGPVEFNLVDPSYNTIAETYPIIINANATASATNTLTIKPAVGNTVNISLATTSAVFGLLGADYIIIDGSSSAIPVSNSVCPRVQASRNMSITNTGSGATNQSVIFIMSNGFDGATNNIIRNLNIVGNSNTTTIAGIALGTGPIASGLSSGTSPFGFGNNNNTIENNSFTKSQYGIVSFGNSYTVKNQNNIYQLNQMNGTGANAIGRVGIMIGNENNDVVAGNTIANIIGQATGISVAGISCGSQTSITSTFTGSFEVTNTLINYNVIDNIQSFATIASQSAAGIALGSGPTGVVSSGTNVISNNMISQVATNGNGSSNANLSAGIYIGNQVGSTIKIYNNSVSMNSTTFTSSLNIASSYALYVLGTGVIPSIDVENNIFSNTSRAGTGNNFVVGLQIQGTSGNYPNLIANNNDLYYTTGGGVFNAIGVAGVGTGVSAIGFFNFPTLAAWQIETGREASSVSVAPVFTSSSDLHLVPTNATNWAFNGTALVLPSVSNDIDCNSRTGSFSPDMGADEFSLPPVDLAFAGIKPTSTTTCHGINESIIVTVRNTGSSSLDLSVNPIVVNCNVTGIIAASASGTVNTGTLAANQTIDVTLTPGINTTLAGTYTFATSIVPIAGESSVLNNDSTVAVVIFNAPLAVTTNSSAISICLGNSTSATATATGGTSPYTYSWDNGIGAGSTVNLAPSTNTTYTVTATDACGATSTATVSVTVNIPGVASTTPGTRCGVGTVLLSATADPGSTLLWYNSPFGQTIAGSGNTYTTPSISTTTNFYTSAITGTSAFSTGLTNLSPTNGVISYSLAPGKGEWITATKAGSITGATVYPSIGGPSSSVLITLRTRGAASTIISSAGPFTFTPAQVGTPVRLSFNLPVATPGDYQINYEIPSTPSAVFTATVASSVPLQQVVMTVTSVTSGTIYIGQSVTGTGLSPARTIIGFLTGSGGVGTYLLSGSFTLTLPSTTITAVNAIGLGGYDFNYTGGAYPFYTSDSSLVIVGGISTITGATSSTSSYYSFWNLEYTTYCESARVPVTATVSAPATLTIPAVKNLCIGDISDLTVSSTLSDYDTYTWSPATNLFTDPAATIPYVLGNSATTVYVSSAIAGTQVYTCTAVNNTTNCSNVTTSTVTIQPALTGIFTNTLGICGSGTATLNVTPATGFGVGGLLWESSTDNISWTSIPGSTTTLTTPILTQSTYFRASSINTTSAVCSQQVLPSQVIVSNPLINTTTPGSVCGTGVVTLGATTVSGGTPAWYSTASSPTPLATGTSFNTPAISTTTTYYVAAQQGITSTVNGLPTCTSNFGSFFSVTDRPLWITVLKPGTIQYVTVYPTAIGTFTINLRARGQSSDLIVSPIFSVIAANVGTAVVIPLNMSLNVGSYQLTTIGSSLNSLAYNGTGNGYPFINAENSFQIIGTANNSTSAAAITSNYGPLFNIVYNTACESPRTPVVATVNTALPFTLNTNSAISCGNSAVMLDVTSTLSNYATYFWSPQAGLYLDAAATIPYLGTSETTVYAMPTLTTLYTATANDPILGCTSIQTANIGKISIDASATNATVTTTCNGGSSILTATGIVNANLATFAWEQSSDNINWTIIPGANSTTYLASGLSSSAYYRCGVYCSGPLLGYTPVVLINVFDPQIQSTSGGLACGSGTISLSATPNAGATINWFSVATGGTSLGSGNSFVTPLISSTTTYYAEASAGSYSEPVGLPYQSGSGVQSVDGRGLKFTATKQLTLVSTTVSDFPFSGSAFMRVVLQNSAGVPLDSSALYPVSGQTVIPLNFNVPAGADYRLVCSSSAVGTYNTGPVFTSPLNSASGAMSITKGYFSAGVENSQYYLFFDIQISASCYSARQPVVATITPATPITPAASATTVCSGSTVNLSVTSANDPFNTYAWYVADTLYTTGANAIVNPLVTTTYTVIGTNTAPGPNLGCQAVNTITITANPSPTPVYINPGSVTLCGGGTTNLEAILTVPDSGRANIGSNSSLNFNGFTNYPALYGEFYESAKHQMLIYASELTANGMTNGSEINSLLDSVQLLGAAGILNGYSIKLSATNLTALTTWVTGSFTQVYGPTNYQPVAGLNTHNFSTPFIWDGVSNVIVEVCFSNDPSGTLNASTSNPTTRRTVTPTTTVIYSNVNDQDICPTLPIFLTSNERPNMMLGYSKNATYSWSPATGLNTTTGTTVVATATSTITYTVTASNANGCTTSASVPVNVTAQLAPKISQGDTLLCFPNEILLFVVDTGLYAGGYPAGTTVDWVGIVNGLSPNVGISSSNGSVYQAKVILPNGCFAFSAPVTIITRSVTVVPVISPASCGNNNGKVVANVTAGNAPFHYVWSDGLSTIRDTVSSSLSDSITNLAPGTYNLTIFDNYGLVVQSCNSGSIPFVVSGNPALIASYGSSVDISCNGAADGTATVAVTGGGGTYTYVWSNGQTTASVFGLAGGTYTVTVSDQFGCSDTAEFVITEPSVLVPGYSQVDVFCNGGSNASITANITGGTAPYQIDWFDNSFSPLSSGTSISNLSAGSYFMVVTDAHGCFDFAQITINEPSAGSIDDNNVCTIDACDPLNGTVSHTPINVDDNNLCTIDACDPINGPYYTAVNIDDNNVCTTDACDPLTGISHTAISIDDANLCTIDACDPITGVSHTPVSVDDANACTIDACDLLDGSISHTPVVTDDNDPCTIDGCDVLTGVYHNFNPSVYYADLDNDGFGGGAPILACPQPLNTVTNNLDCDDSNAAVNPNATEVCNFIDDDCDGTIDEGGLPAAGAISGSTALCIPVLPGTTSFTIPAIPGATSYTWSVPSNVSIISGQGTNSITIGWSAIAAHDGIVGQVCVYGYNPCGSSAASCVNVAYTYTAPVTPPSVSGSARVCPGDIVVYSIATVNRASFYTWSAPVGVSIMSGQGTNVITAQIGAGFTGGNLTVAAGNACGVSPVRIRTLLLNVLSAPASIAGQANGVCGSGSISYTATPVVGATSYTWTAPSGASIVSGQGTNSVVISYSGSFTSGTLSVYAVNGCGAGNARALTVTGAPAQPGVITGPVAICPGAIGTVYSVATVPGTLQYTWTVPATATITGGQFTKIITVDWANTPASGQTISVKTSNNCGTSSFRLLSGINVNASNCLKVSDAASVSTMNLNAWPNPTHDLINISFMMKNEGNVKISLRDVTGRIIINQTTGVTEGQNQTQLNLEGLNSGIYFIIVETGNDLQQMRVVVE